VNLSKINKPQWWQHSASAWNEVDSFLSDYNALNRSKKNQTEEHFEVDNWRTISTGRSNNSYYFSNSKCKLFIQIINRSNNKFLPYESAICLEKIIDADEYSRISPWIVETFFESKEVRIQQWIESESLDLSLNKNEKIIELLAKFLADLHQITSNKLPSFNLKEHLMKYQTIALSKVKNRELKQEINTCLEKAVLLLETYQGLTLCHYDLNLNNILINKKTSIIKVIDWEYVCIGDPILDITAIISNLEFAKEQEIYFISCYRKFFDKRKFVMLNLSETKLNNMKLLNQYIYQLWEYGQ
jgi:thiamine kinase-like enzyme